MSTVLETRHISKRFRSDFYVESVQALDDISLTVEEGEVFGLIGHNGAGKTTFIKILTRLIKPTSGEGEVLGRPLGDLRALERIGFLPERPYFYEHLTPREALRFYGRLSNLKGADLKARVEAELTRFNLEAAANRPLRTFSKGMLQRVGMAQAVLHDPELVILDEPMSGLDPIGRGEIKDAIQDLKQRRKTIFFSTHILNDVEQLCSKVALFVHGRLHYIGGVEELLREHEQGQELVFTSLDEAGRTYLRSLGGELFERGSRPVCFLPKDVFTPELLAAIVAHGLVPEQVSPRRMSLEDIFRQTYAQADSQEARA